MNATEYKAKLIKLIHISKKNVFLDDEMRRDFIVSRIGVNSLKDMSINELKLMLDFCRGEISDIPMFPMTSKQSYTINRLWQQKARNKDDKALELFIFNKTKKSFCHLTKSEAQKVLIALKSMY